MASTDGSEHRDRQPWEWTRADLVLRVAPGTLSGSVGSAGSVGPGAGSARWLFDGLANLPAGARVLDPARTDRGLRATVAVGESLLRVTIELADGPGAVAFSVEPAGGRPYEATLVFPGPLRPADARIEELALPLRGTNGIVYRPGPGDDVDLAVQIAAGNLHGMSMPFWSVSTAESGTLAIVDDPDDAEVTIRSTPGGGTDVAVGWLPSMGTLRYRRGLTVTLPARPGYVAAATAYREHVQRAGRFRSLAAKIADRPAVAAVVGGPYFSTGYLPFSERKFRQVVAGLAELGYEQGLIGPIDFVQWGAGPWLNDYQPFISAPEFGPIAAAGGMTAFAWLYLEDILTFDPHFDESILTVGPGGSGQQGWANRDYRYRRVCSKMIAERGRRLRQRISGFDAVHFDTTTAKALIECWSQAHPMTRSEDREARHAWLAEVAGWGLVVGSEAGSDWAFDVLDFCSNNPRRGLETNFPAPAFHVPLQGLVYHDSIVSYCWEYDPYNKSYWGGDWSREKLLYDVMCGNPPTVSPVLGYFPVISGGEAEVSSRWVTWEDEQTQRLLAAAVPVARLHARTATTPITGHEFLDEECAVSRTVYGDGTEVVVNAGTEPFAGAGVSVPPSSYLIDGRVSEALREWGTA